MTLVIQPHDDDEEEDMTAAAAVGEGGGSVSEEDDDPAVASREDKDCRIFRLARLAGSDGCCCCW